MPKILFVHENFPAQFGGLAISLMNQGWDVLFATAAEHVPLDHKVHVLGGLRVVRYKRARDRMAATHQYLHNSEDAVLNAQGAVRLGAALMKGGYMPDLVVAHSGWGSGSLMKVAWPNAKFVQYLEWWYNSPAPDMVGSAKQTNPEDSVAKTLCKNLPFLLDVQSADMIVAPTQFQADQFPKFLTPLVNIQHDGVDCEFFKPAPDGAPKFTLEGLPEDAPVLSYATRGMEPLRGFPQFMAAASRLQQQFPNLHVVIAGTDAVHYGPRLPKGQSFKMHALKRHTFDMERLHFVGRLPKPVYRDLLQRSTVHVYLTRPFVMSWSFVEAMATGCAIVTARNEAIEEFATDHQHALLSDMDDVAQIAANVGKLLNDDILRRDIGQAARSRALERYNAKDCHTALADVFLHLIGSGPDALERGTQNSRLAGAP